MKKVNDRKRQPHKANIINPFIDVPDRTEEILKGAHEANVRRHEQTASDQRHRELLKQNRILSTKENKYTHAVDTILEWIEKVEYPNSLIGNAGNQRSCSIDYHYFNFEDRFDASRGLFEPFLNKLKSMECISAWKRQTHVRGSRYIFFEVNKDKLKEYKNELVPKNEKSKTDNNLQDYVDPDLANWLINKNHHAKGTYEISPDEKITFRSGRFGGMNELIKNSGNKITGDQLKSAIKNNLQKGDGMNLNIAKWKYDLIKDTKFSKFFVLKFKQPSSYRLYLLKQK